MDNCNIGVFLSLCLVCGEQNDNWIVLITSVEKHLVFYLPNTVYTVLVLNQQLNRDTATNLPFLLLPPSLSLLINVSFTQLPPSHALPLSEVTPRDTHSVPTNTTQRV